MSSPSNQPQLPAGAMVGPYQIGGLIVATDLGIFHTAANTATNEPCILKLLPTEVAQEDAFRKRLKWEGMLLSRLQHENIIQSLGFGESEGRVYLALEPLDGGPLQAWIDATAPANAGMPPVKVKRIIEQILRGLIPVHRAGIVHRNLSPTTLWMTRAGQVKFADFYLARSYSPLPDDPSDSRSDLWAVGILAYHFLTGRKPSGLAELASQLLPGLDRRWDVFIGTCLKEDPADRYQTADAALEGLQRLDATVSRWRRWWRP